MPSSISNRSQNVTKQAPEKYTLKLFPGDSTIDSLLTEKGLRPHLAYVYSFLKI